MALINGTDTSLFFPVSTRDAEIEFPLTNENGGLQEDWEWAYIEHELSSYRLIQKHEGYRLIWDFNFDDWADGTTLMKFKALKNSMDLGIEWYLRPRNEDQYLWRYFKVICTSENFKVILDSTCEWHTGFHIQFKTVDIVGSIDWTLIIPTITPIEYCALLDNFAIYI